MNTHYSATNILLAIIALILLIALFAGWDLNL